jgi:two-component system sensor histidine kinase/response regulator
MASDRERFLAAGMDDYLSKPIEERALVQALSRWLRCAPIQSNLTHQSAQHQHQHRLPQLPGVDVGRAVARLNGKLGMFLQLLDDFRARYCDVDVRFRQLLACGDLAEIKALAHSLRGAAATLGADRLAASASALELAGSTESRAQALTEMTAAIDQLGRQTTADQRDAFESGVSEPSDQAGLQQTMNELESALRDRRFDAQALSKRLLPALPRDAKTQPVVDTLIRAMGELDYATAELQLHRLRKALGKSEERA